MSKKNEVAVAQDNLNTRALAMKQQASEMAEQMKELGIEATDLTIPVLLLMQNTSEAVGDGHAKLGDIMNSQAEEVVGSPEKPLEVIPLKMYKTLRIYNTAENPPKFVREEPYEANVNGRLPFEGLETDPVTEETFPVKRYLNFNFFVLLKAEIESDQDFPAIVRFKSTSMPAGRQLATQLFKMAALRQLPYSQTVKITVGKEKKGSNTYAVFGIGKGQKATDKEKAAAEKWLAMLSSVSYRVDEKEETEAETAAKAPVVVEAEVAGPY